MKAVQGTDYFELLRLVRGLGAYPLKGSYCITKEIVASVLFRTAEDTVSRAGIRQSVLIPPQPMVDKFENLLTVATVAQILDVTRAAVYTMLRDGRIKGTKYGNISLIKREDLEQFRAKWPGPKRKRSESTS
jgi:excisionase family DNA binding protein